MFAELGLGKTIALASMYNTSVLCILIINIHGGVNCYWLSDECGLTTKLIWICKLNSFFDATFYANFSVSFSLIDRRTGIAIRGQLQRIAKWHSETLTKINNNRNYYKITCLCNSSRSFFLIFCICRRADLFIRVLHIYLPFLLRISWLLATTTSAIGPLQFCCLLENEQIYMQCALMHHRHLHFKFIISTQWLEY